MGAGNAGDYAYGDIVVHPFGYGLSYTDFKFSDMTVNYNDALDVLYRRCQGHEHRRSRGQAHRAALRAEPLHRLLRQSRTASRRPPSPWSDSGKTGELAPGTSEIVTMNVNKRDIASYDHLRRGHLHSGS